MIILKQFQAAFGQPSGSPFCVKTHLLLKMGGIEYKTVDIDDPRKTPKGKLPVIEDDGKEIADTFYIRRHLERKYGIDFDEGLSASDRAAAHAFSSLVDEHLYWAGVYSRWIDDAGWPIVKSTFFTNLPGPLKFIIPPVARGQIRSQLKGHGLGRHSAAEIYEMGSADIDTVAVWLGDKPFFMGDKPSSADASVYAMTASIVDAPFESPLKKAALAKPNLVAYCERLKAKYFP
ncbi:glutathione S-transferase [Rhodoligotrophos appendicifer]|uniref:glutathione S-transferase family protein n=1 Tax=Rhodoligotrophos appendicifer TaxID=987056 RepID=UPI0011808F87|nr:glutathione S-transferase family protein [Rhodoligotrophos appendicifer]